MAVLDVTAFTNALQKLYPRGLEEMVYKTSPSFAWLPKTTGFEGVARQVRPIISNINGSNNFQTALAGKSTPSIQDFTVTRVKTYVLGSIDNEALMASRSSRGATAEAVKTQVDAALREFGRAAAHQIWNNGGGARGQSAASSGISGTTITLTDARDMANFEKGMVLELSSTDGTSGAVRTGTVVITALNRNGPTITVDSTITTAIPGATSGDYVFRAGDHATSYSSGSLTGIPGWVTISATPGALFGVTRTTDVTRLAGDRYTATGDIESSLISACAQGRQNGGGMYDAIWLNSVRYGELLKSLNSKLEIEVSTDNPRFSFRRPAMATPAGVLPIMDDPNVPYRYGWLLQRDSWELAGLGEMPHFSKEDGLKFSRETSQDAIEFRLKAYWQLICKRPGDNMVVDFGAAT